MNTTDFHLALDAIVALVDGELSHGARGRAMAHLSSCPQCRYDVEAQRGAKSALVGAGGPALPADLLSRLREIPFTTDLGRPEFTLAKQGSTQEWTPVRRPALPRTAPLPPGVPPDSQPVLRDGSPTHPPTRRPGLSPARMRRLRRGLVGAMAGLTVGVLASVAPVAVTAGSGAAAPRPVDGTEPVDWSTTFTPLGETPAFAGLTRP